MIPHLPMSIRSKGRGHKVQKDIEGDQLASMSYVLFLSASNDFM